MTDQSGVPESPPRGPSVGPGWYKIDRQVNAEAYWDGQRWTKTRRWNGTSWVEDGWVTTGEANPGGEPPGYGPSVGNVSAPPPGPRMYAPPMMTQTPTNQRVMVQSTNGLAIASLVLSILGLVGIGSLLGIIFGVRARRQIRESRGYQSGDGLALAGIIIGIVTLVLTAIGLAFWIAAFAYISSSVHSTTTSLYECQADVKSVDVAITAYQAQHRSAPGPPAPWSAATYSSNYAPLTVGTGGGAYLQVAPSVSNYVVEYDASGNVWVAPPGQYETSFQPEQGIDNLLSACEAATGG